MKKLFSVITLSALLLAQTPAQAQWWIADYFNRTAQPQSVAQKIISACTPTTNSHNTWQTFALWGGIVAGIGLVTYALYPYPSLDKKVDEFLAETKRFAGATSDIFQFKFKQKDCDIVLGYDKASTDAKVVVSISKNQNTLWKSFNTVPTKREIVETINDMNKQPIIKI